jgi:hypothetical protein
MPVRVQEATEVDRHGPEHGDDHSQRTEAECDVRNVQPGELDMRHGIHAILHGIRRSSALEVAAAFHQIRCDRYEQRNARAAGAGVEVLTVTRGGD